LGTDRDLEDKGPCPCGKGKITVTRCSPDHPWGGEVWYENQIECEACERTYTFADSDKMSDKRGRLVLRQDVEERATHRREWLAKADAIMAMPAARQILTQAKSIIDRQRSVAAKYQLLSHHGLASMSESTFRKRFRDSDSYLEGLGARSLPAVLKLVGKESAEIAAALADAEKSLERYHDPIPTVNHRHHGS
jgi:hypothetical protein